MFAPAKTPQPVVDKLYTSLAAVMKEPDMRERLIAQGAEPLGGSPADLRKYPLGSVLAGGDSGPYGDERAKPAEWLKLAREFHSVALENRPGHEPIPVIFGVDAVHGHNNVVGAELYPHNIGLGAMHDPDLVRRIAEATAEEVATTGIDYAFAPTIAVPCECAFSASPTALNCSAIWPCNSVCCLSASESMTAMVTFLPEAMRWTSSS